VSNKFSYQSKSRLHSLHHVGNQSNSGSPFHTSVEFQRLTSIYQLTFNVLHQYISWLSTCYIYTSVYLQRAASIHQLTQRLTSTYQLTFNGLHQYISWRSTGCVCMDYRRGTSIYLLTFNGLHGIVFHKTMTLLDDNMILTYIIIMKPSIKLLTAALTASQTHFLQVYIKQKESKNESILLFCHWWSVFKSVNLDPIATSSW
jgi:hypothetical protein